MAIGVNWQSIDDQVIVSNNENDLNGNKTNLKFTKEVQISCGVMFKNGEKKENSGRSKVCEVAELEVLCQTQEECTLILKANK